ncbi:glycosyltransferase [Aliivibrio finisterrensis]|uniref:Glycosyltransferase n=1 Tax=Aliivibrio finisterrensis TaxID=511998 RepID=A0ABY0I3F0_9GAMM|nr:glycosyltransferase [Aliivibrio finisterrensis]RYU61828.1 glycosyltransferase [Aliivibrio finisterrensis]RYU80704.1 glycosyltransferase [Aliivibrio finisterrensis]
MECSYDLTVAICTFNRSAVLNETLFSLQKQISVSEYNVQVIVIDNNSTDDTRMVVESNGFINCYFIENKQGLSHARNKAIDLLNSNYLCFIDDDAVPCDNWLDNIIQATIKYPDVHFFGGRILPDPHVRLPFWFDDSFHGLYSLQDFGNDVTYYSSKSGPVGANMVISRDVIRNERFNTKLGRVGNNLLSGEETEFFVRLGFLNHASIYVGNACVIHKFQVERYKKGWVIQRFKADGVSSRVMFGLSPSLKGLFSPLYHFIYSIFKFNTLYAYCSFVRLAGFIKGKV